MAELAAGLVLVGVLWWAAGCPPLVVIIRRQIVYKNRKREVSDGTL